jgi:hypothetical protein
MHTTNHLIYRRSTTIALTAESHRCMPRIRALVPSAASHATLRTCPATARDYPTRTEIITGCTATLH